MKRILHYGAKTYPPSHGGVEKIVFDLIGHCDEFESFVIADSVETPSIYVIKRDSGFIKSVLQLIALCRDQKIDAIHFHKETSIPIALIMRLMGHKTILTLHGFGWKVPRWSKFSRLALWSLDLAAYFFLHKIVFCSESDYKSVKKYIGLNKLVCIENGVDVSLNPDPLCGRRGGVYLGRVSPEKNIFSLRDLNKSVEFKVFGPVDKRDSEFVRNFNSALTTGSIEYGGVVMSEDVPSVLRKFCFLVNLSFSEGLPVAVLEAASQGLFLVLSDIAAHRALGFPDCIYIDPHRADLAKLDFSTLKPSERNQAWVKERFSLQSMAGKYAKLYREVLNG